MNECLCMNVILIGLNEKWNVYIDNLPETNTDLLTTEDGHQWWGKLYSE